MTTPEGPNESPRDDIDLTADDESALDKAWDSVTDADIAASITWLEEVNSDRPAKAPKAHRD